LPVAFIVRSILEEGEESPNWDMHALAPAGNISVLGRGLLRNLEKIP
jgi:hypothetical protein